MDYITKNLKDWLGPLRGEWPPLYMVGGAVRDHFLSRTPKDIDLMCQSPEELARRIAAVRNAAVVPFQKKADEPCFRVADRKHPGSFIDIALMRGDTVFEDLSRRDFTINAAAIRVKQGGELGEVIDPLNGTSDMKQGVIRMTCPEAFLSDPLRILRAVRFAASLGFTIDKPTLAAMETHVRQIEKTASERVLVELLEVFRAEQSAGFVRMMDDLGLLNIIFPEIIPLKECTQNTYHHLNVWDHSMLVLNNCEHTLNHLQDIFGTVAAQVSENLTPHNRVPLLKLTALLHDVGKPKTWAVKEDSGRITFYGHDKEGAEMVSEIAERLRMSNRDHDFIHTLVAEHLHILNLFFNKAKPSTRMRWFRKLTDDCIPIIILGMADIGSTLGPASSQERIDAYHGWSVKTVEAYYGKIKKQLERRDLINGKDLIDRGMAPGPEMGRVLREVREAQDTGQIRNREEALALAEASKR